MKRAVLVAAGLLAASMIMYSCSKEEDEPEPAPRPEYVDAKVDDDNFRSTEAGIDSSKISNVLGAVKGFDQNLNQTISMTFPKNLTEGTYTENNSGVDVVLKKGTAKRYELKTNSNTGITIDFTNVDGVYEGTFEFIAVEVDDNTDTVKVTDGFFKVTR